MIRSKASTRLAQGPEYYHLPTSTSYVKRRPRPHSAESPQRTLSRQPQSFKRKDLISQKEFETVSLMGGMRLRTSSRGRENVFRHGRIRGLGATLPELHS